MVISGMNRFFARHGRVTLGVLVIIISVSFVLYLSAGASIGNLFDARSYRDNVGEIAGRGVSRDEFSQQLDHAILSVCLASPLYTPKDVPPDRMRPLAARRLVWLHAAAERGIDVSRDEVAAALREAPVFQREGKFDLETFKRYAETQLEPAGFTREDLDQAVRETLVLERLQREVMDALVISPREVRANFDEQKVKFVVKVLRFEPTAAELALPVAEEELTAFFEKRRDRYQMPVQSRVELVRFNHLDFKATATAAVTDAVVAEYYQAHPEEFAGQGEGAAPKPLVEVDPALRLKLIDARIREAARLAAEQFAEEAYNRGEEAVERAKSGAVAELRLGVFRAVAAEFNLKSQAVDWFGADAVDLPRIGREAELVAAVQELDLDQPVSDVIEGQRAVFVAMLLERQEERPAELAERRDLVLADCREEKVVRLTRERARIAVLKLGEALTAGQELQVAASGAGVVPEEVAEFSASQPPPVPDGPELSELAMATAVGQVSALGETRRGALAVLVEQRTLPSETEFAAQKDQFSKGYHDWKAGTAWQGFAMWLESRAKFAFQQ